MNLTEAFQKLDLLESEDFDITSSTDKADLRNFIDEDDVDSEIDIIDLQKDEEDELDDSYVGKIVTECVICHSKFYKDPDEIKLDVESGNCNVDEECPICFSQDGYKVIGKIEPVSDEEIEDSQSDDIDVDDEIDDEVDIDETDDDIEETNESYRRRGRAIREAKKHSCKNCDDDLDETLGGTLKGAAVGLLSGHPIKGALAGSAASNIKAGKDNWFERAKLGAATDGFKGVVDSVKKSIGGQQDESLQEGIESAEIVTDDDVISIGTGEDGSFNISSSPKDDGMGMEGETIVPIEPEDAQQIVDAQNQDEEEMEEMPEEGQEPEQEVDVDVQDFDDESFDNLGESYLKRVYENVNRYKTTCVTKKGNKLVVEGVINFNSGKTKKTSFIFESYKITKSGKVKFIGENAQITRGRKAFTLTGNLRRKKFITESLNYNYRQRDSRGNSVRLYGTVRR